jgi:hypothetical protein
MVSILFRQARQPSKPLGRLREAAMAAFAKSWRREQQEESPPMRAVAIVLALLLAATGAGAEPLPVPKPAIGGSCSHGWLSSGSFCIPRAGAQPAVPKPLSGTCPWGWTSSGSYCLRSGASIR